MRGDPNLGTTRVYAMNGQSFDDPSTLSPFANVTNPIHEATYSTNMLAQGVMNGEWVGDLCEIKMFTGIMSDNDFGAQAKHLLYKWVE